MLWCAAEERWTDSYGFSVDGGSSGNDIRKHLYVSRSSTSLFSAALHARTEEGTLLAFPLGHQRALRQRSKVCERSHLDYYSSKGRFRLQDRNNGARVVIDTSSSGLEFQASGCSQWNLEKCLSNVKSSKPSFSVVLLGELSFELTTAGLDFGFLIMSDSSLVDTFYSFPSLSQPHSTLKYTFRKLLGLKNQKDQHFSDLIVEQKETLKNRANQLIKTLKSCGWEAAGCHGGISMLAKPTAYIGKSLKVDGFEGKLDSHNIREALLKSTGLCISSSAWTGVPDYCRFSFALESSEFDRAMECITRFKELVLGGSAKVNGSN